VNILVVDDEPDLSWLIRQKFRKRIRSKEIVFSFAGDGIEALECLAEDPSIDIVVTDINMPRMDGLTLLDRLGDWPHPLKVVIVSAYGDMSNIRTAMNRGAFDFITKPIDFSDLELTLEKTHRELETHRRAETLQRRVTTLERELDVARKIQTSSLPTTFPPFPDRSDFELHAVMHPAREVGGDFYDFFLLDEHRLGFVLGDVSGKGLPAALFMANTRTLLRATALQGMPPDACLRRVNRVLHDERVKGMFVTLIYGILDVRTGEVAYCNAGHNLPFHLHRRGDVTMLPRARSLAVCLVADFAFPVHTLRLAPGDTLFLYTDGVTEAADANRNQFEDDRLHEHLRSANGAAPDALIRHVLEAVTAFAGDAPQADDITMLAVRYQA